MRILRNICVAESDIVLENLADGIIMMAEYYCTFLGSSNNLIFI
jgi:hypothetical protein